MVIFEFLLHSVVGHVINNLSTLNGQTNALLIKCPNISVRRDEISTLYIDNLSSLLNSITCQPLIIADDICLLAPSAVVLQRLINVCLQY